MEKCISYEEHKKERKQQALWDLNHPFLAWVKSLRYLPFRFWHSCEVACLEFKSYWVRGAKGWSKMDSWWLSGYLAGIITESVKHLKENMHGYISYNNDMSDDENEARSKWVLDEIIWSFDMYHKCSLGADWDFYCEQLDPKFVEEHSKEFDVRFMTKEENKRMREGMKLFIEHYDSLYD